MWCTSGGAQSPARLALPQLLGRSLPLDLLRDAGAVEVRTRHKLEACERVGEALDCVWRVGDHLRRALFLKDCPKEPGAHCVL